MADPFTAAELRAIGERAKRASESTDWPADWPSSACDVTDQLAFDLIRVHAVLGRLIERRIKESCTGRGFVVCAAENKGHYLTKDAAIDALLQGGV